MWPIVGSLCSCQPLIGAVLRFFFVKQHLRVKFSMLGQLQGCWVSWKKACIAFPLILLSILALIWHLTNRRSCCFGSCRCSMDSAASCGRLGPLSEEASFSSNNEPNIDIYFTNPAFQASCKGSLALLHFISSQIILWWCIPKNESRECGGGEGKVPVLTATLMASIWVFGEKHLWILQLKLLSTVCCCLDIITEVFCLFLQSAFHCGGIIGGLHMVLRWAGWFDWPTSK